MPALWSELGVSRQNSHVILDYVASQCTPELISEDLIKDLFSKITGTQQIEENGRNCVMALFLDNLAIQSGTLLPLFLQLRPLLNQDIILHYYSLFIGLFTSTEIGSFLRRY